MFQEEGEDDQAPPTNLISSGFSKISCKLVSVKANCWLPSVRLWMPQKCHCAETHFCCGFVADVESLFSPGESCRFKQCGVNQDFLAINQFSRDGLEAQGLPAKAWETAGMGFYPAGLILLVSASVPWSFPTQFESSQDWAFPSMAAVVWWRAEIWKK